MDLDTSIAARGTCSSTQRDESGVLDIRVKIVASGSQSVVGNNEAAHSALETWQSSTHFEYM